MEMLKILSLGYGVQSSTNAQGFAVYRHLDLFTGIGGFPLGFQRAGMTPIAFCENAKQPRQVLARHWPEIRIFPDATRTDELIRDVGTVDIISGGDPCPHHSRAKAGRKSKTPDMSGYFLAVVAGCRPRWVVRENVPAPASNEFATVLEHIGYRTCLLRANASGFTAQNREREFVIGCIEPRKLNRFMDVMHSGEKPDPQVLGTRKVTSCLTCHRFRYNSGDNYVWHPTRNQFRVLDAEERTAFAGFPPGWLGGFSETACARMTGNAVVVPVVEAIGRAIIKAEDEIL